MRRNVVYEYLRIRGCNCARYVIAHLGSQLRPLAERYQHRLAHMRKHEVIVSEIELRMRLQGVSDGFLCDSPNRPRNHSRLILSLGCRYPSDSREYDRDNCDVDDVHEGAHVVDGS